MPFRRGIARRDIIWWFVGFLALQVGLAIWIELRHPELRSPEYGRKLASLKLLLAQHPDRPLFLALGSSRTLNGFRPERLDGLMANGTRPQFFNFGLTSHSALHQLAAFNRLINDGIRPRWMLIEVTPSFLSIQTSASYMIAGNLPEWSDLSILRRYEPWPPRLYAKWLEARSAPWFSDRFAILHRYMAGWLPDSTPFKAIDRIDRGGYLPLQPARSHEEWQKRVDDARHGHAPNLQYFAISEVSARATRELLARCRAMGISTALVLTPESSLFLSWYGPETNKLLDKFVQQLGDEFGVPVHDARTWVPDEYFWDGHHLLPAGAELYTDRLRNEVIDAMLNTR